MALQIPQGDERRHNLINGAWVPPASGLYEPCINPADTREQLGHFPKSGKADALAAIEAAHAAFPAWAATPGPERGRVIGRAWQILKGKVELLAEALCREEGKTLGESKGEVMKGINLLEFYAGEGFRQHGKTLPSESRQTLTFTLRQPVGPVALITPWNFPFAIPAWKLAPALVAGCSVVLKPASLTPDLHSPAGRGAAGSGASRGRAQLRHRPGLAIGDVIVDDPRIRPSASPAPTRSAIASHGPRRARREGHLPRWAARTRPWSWATPTWSWRSPAS